MSLKRLCLGTKSIIPQLRGKRDQNTHLKLEQLTLDSGLVDLEMAKEFKYGLMVHVMKVLIVI